MVVVLLLLRVVARARARVLKVCMICRSIRCVCSIIVRRSRDVVVS